jgi:hypothetical protein
LGARFCRAQRFITSKQSVCQFREFNKFVSYQLVKKSQPRSVAGRAKGSVSIWGHTHKYCAVQHFA